MTYSNFTLYPDKMSVIHLMNGNWYKNCNTLR